MGEKLAGSNSALYVEHELDLLTLAGSAVLTSLQMRRLPAPTRRFPGHQNHVYVIWPTANEIPCLFQ